MILATWGQTSLLTFLLTDDRILRIDASDLKNAVSTRHKNKQTHTLFLCAEDTRAHEDSLERLKEVLSSPPRFIY